MEYGYCEFLRKIPVVKAGILLKSSSRDLFAGSRHTLSLYLDPADKPRDDVLAGRRNGFTLIEILIVMLIISIISSVAVMTISFNPQKKIESAANSLANTITLAAEEAMLRPATLGLALSENSYTFFIYEEPKNEDANPWKPLRGRVFHKHTFPKEAEISLKVQDQTVPLNGHPQIIIAESGDFTPFTITIKKTGDKPSYQIHGNTNGEVTTELSHDK